MFLVILLHPKCVFVLSFIKSILASVTPSGACLNPFVWTPHWGNIKWEFPLQLLTLSLNKVKSLILASWGLCEVSVLACGLSLHSQKHFITLSNIYISENKFFLMYICQHASKILAWRTDNNSIQLFLWAHLYILTNSGWAAGLNINTCPQEKNKYCNTAAHRQGAIEMFWLYPSGAFMLSVFI